MAVTSTPIFAQTPYAKTLTLAAQTADVELAEQLRSFELDQAMLWGKGTARGRTRAVRH